MSFRDHPVFTEHHHEEPRPQEAVIIRLADRKVITAPVAPSAPAPLPVSDRTARQLSRLAENRWFVIDDMTGTDHLVIGPAGAVAVRVHRLCGRVVATAWELLHNGVGTDHQAEAIVAARRTAARLSRASGFAIPVRPLLVIEAEQLIVPAQPHDVPVIGSHKVTRWFERQPITLDRTTAFRVAIAARRLSTWS
jgi:hypothetical protein